MIRRQAGFTMIELMVTLVIMAVISTGVAQFAALSFREQMMQTRETVQMSAVASATTILERDVLYAGFGLPAGVAAFQVRTGVTSPTSNELVISGLPLAGPRHTPWTYLLQAASADTVLLVRCFGQVQGATVYPDPLTDVVIDGGPLKAQFFNYVGHTPAGLPPGGVSIIHGDTTCGQTVGDYDGDGSPDMAMRLTLDTPISAAAGTLVLPLRTYPGMVTTAVRYFVAERQLWRETAGAAVPVIGDVEAFQVQFGWSTTDGTFAPGNWSGAPMWQADLRQRAIRYQLILAREQFGGGAVAQVAGVNFTYPVPAGSERFHREELRRSVYTPNALFSHP